MRRALLAFLLLLPIHAAGGEPLWQTLPPTPAPVPGEHTGHAKVNGINFYYATIGHGSPVVLLHGGLANSDTAAWRALRAQVEGPIYVAGDSAGGGLALALMLNLRDHKEHGPDAACLFSPWTDLAATGASVKTNRDRDPVLAFDNVQMIAAAYAGEAGLRTPLISPLYGDLAGLPPMLVFVGDTEILLDDAKRVVERARSAGVFVELRIFPDMPHVWPGLNVILPEGRQALDEAAAFLLAAGGSVAAA